MVHLLKGFLNYNPKENKRTIWNFSLGVEPVDHDVLKKPPRKVTAPMIDKRLIVQILTSAVVIVIGTLCVFYAEVTFIIIFFFKFSSFSLRWEMAK